jgi:hypothetical protein
MPDKQPVKQDTSSCDKKNLIFISSGLALHFIKNLTVPPHKEKKRTIRSTLNSLLSENSKIIKTTV